ncbi:heterokaryon incompatibility protein-domain-containing protein [Immersiella caudata]|uniref:Heterokaryon incompatibility protein-domain-containing protein n=1 Tax=Immersiella caudata TaxID=314043 RepID=A0AA39WNT1_9PEZI|nr:heterokaryon incompatibility protein-domain-containing protein [Immersiella caudata]
MSELCERCQQFDIQALGDRAYPWRGYRTKDALNSASEGCLFCSILVQELLPPAKQAERRKTGDWIHLRALRREWTASDRVEVRGPEPSEPEATGLNISRLLAEVTVHTTDGRATHPKVELHVAADEGDPASMSGDIVGRYTERDASSSQQMMASIKSWIKECSHHYDCSRTFSGCEKLDPAGSPLPSRCVRVSRGDNGSLELKLQITTGKVSRYITLSHRWTSETEKISTTKANIADRLQGVGLDNLPPLFTDVFTLAANLDIPYVWIDSLCIIQKDADEWAIEAVKMGDYYQRSVFTVACPGATSAVGLFNKTQVEGSSTPVIRMPYRDSSGQQRGFFYLFQAEQNVEERYESTVAQSELLTRGWIFQEWILSRRVVCYTSTGLFLLCQSKSPRTQIGELVEPELQLPDSYTAKKLQTNKYSLKNSLTDHSLSLSRYEDVEKGPGDHMQADWEHLVEAYSGLHLTCPSKDRLVAMSGIADEFARALRKRYKRQRKATHPWLAVIDKNPPARETDSMDGWNAEEEDDTHTAHIRTYIAGLWLSSIRRGLLWEQVGTGTHNRIPTIPTWSWASISTRVRWDRPSDETWKRPLGKTVCDFELDGVINCTIDEYQSSLIGVDPSATTDSSPLDVLPGDSHGGVASAKTSARFPILRLRAKLQPVVLGEYLPSEQERQVAAHVSSRSSLAGIESWRMVASPLDRGHIAGWASIEHPGLQPPEKQCAPGPAAQERESTQPVLYALHVSTVHGVLGGITLGYLSLFHRVYDVLFVRPVQTLVNGYERVGVGRLFGKEMERGFQDAVIREVRLV